MGNRREQKAPFIASWVTPLTVQKGRIAAIRTPILSKIYFWDRKWPFCVHSGR